MLDGIQGMFYFIYGADHLEAATFGQWQNWGARASTWALVQCSADPSGLDTAYNFQ